MLENILIKYFNLAEDWNDIFEKEEENWNKSYSQLVQLIYDLDELGVLNGKANEIVDELDKIHDFDYDEEGFMINRNLAYTIDYMEYKGILVQYIYDTNTVLFTIKNDDNVYNDSDDIDTIVYRNYTKEDIKKYIDTELKEFIKESE